MAYWTIIGKGIEGDAEGKSFGVTLDTDRSKWTASGPNVSMFFTSRSGKFAFVGVPENGTQLVNDDKAEAAFFKGLNASSKVGASNTGRASETGRNFNWTLDSH